MLLYLCRPLNVIGRSHIARDFKAEQDPGFPYTSCHTLWLGNLHRKMLKIDQNFRCCPENIRGAFQFSIDTLNMATKSTGIQPFWKILSLSCRGLGDSGTTLMSAQLQLVSWLA